MKLLNALKKLEKEGFTIGLSERNLFTARKDGFDRVVEFRLNGGQPDEKSYDKSITCIRTRPINNQDDTSTDYFCGTWHENISQAIRFLAY